MEGSDGRKGSMMRDFSAFGCGRLEQVPWMEKPGKEWLSPCTKNSYAA
ncbi:hypothetical protein ACQCLI_05925 [Pseudomonas nitroreducens]|nr:hypothetical protein [Pseudomonas nitroreducens]